MSPSSSTSPSPRGHSLAKHHEDTVLEASLHGQMRAIREAIESAESDERADVARTYDFEPSSLELGSWGCRNSTTGRCIYHNDEDPHHDYCLICGAPSERK